MATLGIPETMGGYCFSNTVNGHAATVLKTSDVVVSNQADTDKNVDTLLRDLGAKTVISVPLTTVYGLSRGVMMLVRCTPVPFSSTDKDILKTMGYRIGLSIEQAQRSTQLEKIMETGYEITRLFDISEIGNEAVRAFSSIFCTDAATIVF
jgi:GAF domain-containing protein